MNILIKLKLRFSTLFKNYYLKRKYIYIFSILYKLLLLIIFIFYNLYLFHNFLDQPNNNIKTSNIKNIHSLNTSMKDAALKANEFIKNSCEGILIHKIPLNLNKKPLISVIIPIHNREKTIKRAVRSIQNQNLDLIEIILVNDCSIDNSINIIKELNKEDLRIKVIDNKKHMGTLYSRTIGTLISKGEYIFPLDSDDMYLSEDVFKVVYKEAYEKNIDIVNFKGICIWNFKNSTINNHLKEFRTHKKIIIENQPNLGYNSIGRLSLAGKCIKSKVYKKAIRAYGKKRYKLFITNLEDGIMNYIINQFAQNAISILKFGVLIIRSKSSDSVSYQSFQKLKFKIKYIETLFEFSRNTLRGKIGAFFYTNMLLHNKELNITLKDIKYKNLLKSLINKMLSSKYISKINKDKIKNNEIFSKII